MATSTNAYSNVMSNKTITRSSSSRIIKDIRDVLKNPLVDQGIYYKHHETDMLKGYAMIVGPEDTPYHGGFYFFEITYPPEYPYMPPHVVFSTQWNNIRFSPNFYTNGKVCLSILNTWFGEAWSSCDTVRTILLQLKLVFTPVPLLNEPGVSLTQTECMLYSMVIEYYNIDVAVCNTILKTPGYYLPFFDLFYDIVVELFHRDKSVYINRLRENKSKCIAVTVPIYDMTTVLDYTKLLVKIESI